MYTRIHLFILVAIYFVFTYPFTIQNLNLGVTIGWSTGDRPWGTWLLPLWFLLIFFTYRKIDSKGGGANGTFFWSHIALTLIPTLVINYPFVRYGYFFRTDADDPVGRIFQVNIAVTVYLFVQLLFYCFLLFKLFLRKAR